MKHYITQIHLDGYYTRKELLKIIKTMDMGLDSGFFLTRTGQGLSLDIKTSKA